MIQIQTMTMRISMDPSGRIVIPRRLRQSLNADKIYTLNARHFLALAPELTDQIGSP